MILYQSGVMGFEHFCFFVQAKVSLSQSTVYSQHKNPISLTSTDWSLPA